jgi:hypothetical protein
MKIANSQLTVSYAEIKPAEISLSSTPKMRGRIIIIFPNSATPSTKTRVINNAHQLIQQYTPTMSTICLFTRVNMNHQHLFQVID